MYRTLMTIFTMHLFLTACQSILPEDHNRLFRELRGGTLELHREVVIAPGVAHITFQGGTAAYGASEYEPRCELEVRRIMETPQTIPAGSYQIGTVRGLQRMVNHPSVKTRLAAAGDAIQLASDSSSEWYMHTYWMQLISEEHEEAPVLICGGAYNFPFYARYPTLQDMRDSLGDYATLTLRQD